MWLTMAAYNSSRDDASSGQVVIQCTSSPTHSWQILCDNGVLGFLYLPSSTSSGKQPHLSCAITRLLFMVDEAEHIALYTVKT